MWSPCVGLCNTLCINLSYTVDHFIWKTVTWKCQGFWQLSVKTTTNLFAADKYISIIDIDINYTAAGCHGIQLSMLAACNFNNKSIMFFHSMIDRKRQTKCEMSRIFIARQHTDVRYWYSNSVCPSVCPFVAFRYCMETQRYCYSFFNRTALLKCPIELL